MAPSEEESPADDACLFGKLVTTSTHCDTSAVRAFHLSLRNMVGHPDSEPACANAHGVVSCCPQCASPTAVFNHVHACRYAARSPPTGARPRRVPRLRIPIMYVAKGSPWIPLSRAAGSGGMIPTAPQVLAPKASTTCLFFALPSRLISWAVVLSELSNRHCGTARPGSAAARRAAHFASSRCTSPCILGAPERKVIVSSLLWAFCSYLGCKVRLR